jgi:hypothetical protein
MILITMDELMSNNWASDIHTNLGLHEIVQYMLLWRELSCKDNMHNF